jgi:hypothetical protein
MIQTILLFDDKDVELGDFFRFCANEYRSLHNMHFNQDVIIEHKSNSKITEIERSISEYNNSNFLFISYLHGDDDTMYLSNREIVSKDNAYLFTNAFCYTFSCCCGKNLSHILLEKQAHVFWGYKDLAYNMPYYEESFADLAISGLKHFFSNETIENAYNKVKEEYTEKIDALYQEDYFAATILSRNKEAMVVYGNKNMTISDFIINK